MISDVLSWLATAIISLIQSSGYIGVFVLMVLESANIPIPSEIVMPFSGFLAARGFFGLWTVIAVGALGNLVGSVISYWFAEYIVKYRSRFVFLRLLISDNFLERANHFFNKYGSVSVFLSRVLPVVRTFISLSAGIGKMKFSRFVWLTLAGSLIWSAFLAYLGKLLGDNWTILEKYFRQLDVLVLVIIISVAAYWFTHHFKGLPSKIKNNKRA